MTAMYAVNRSSICHVVAPMASPILPVIGEDRVDDGDAGDREERGQGRGVDGCAVRFVACRGHSGSLSWEVGRRAGDGRREDRYLYRADIYL